VIEEEVATNRVVWGVKSINSLLQRLKVEPAAFSVVTLDPHRSPNPRDKPSAYREWLHGLDSLLECAAIAVKNHGRILVTLEPDDLSIYLELLDRHKLRVIEVFAWQKKYSGQNSRRDFENFHDFILIVQRDELSASAPITFLPFSVAGKSEDAAREFNDKSQDTLGARALGSPEPLKPSALFSWIVSNRLKDVDSLLDLTSCGASWSSQLSPLTTTCVDVLWPDEPWFASSFWLLMQRLSDGAHGSSFEKLVAAVANDSLRRLCTCNLLIRHPKRQRRTHVRLAFENNDEPNAAVEKVEGRIDDIAECIVPFLRGQVLDCFGSLSLLSPVAEDICDLLTRDGVAAFLLDGDWTTSLLQLVRSIGHAQLIGTLVLSSSSDSVEPAQVLALVSSGARRFKPHPLWRVREHTFSNEDSDPRGPWRDPGHKGARSGGPGTSFHLFGPPYTWRLIAGDLPPGMWRLNDVTGVIWGTHVELGTWRFRVEATDSLGQRSSSWVTVDVLPQSEAAIYRAGPSEYAWLFEHLPSRGRLKVAALNFRLPIGCQASLIMKASGGSPSVIPIPAPGNQLAVGRTRYWEFIRSSLIDAVLEDRVLFSKASRGRPRLKKYVPLDTDRHAAMPSVMSLNGLSVRQYFWKQISRVQASSIGIDWSGNSNNAEVRLYISVQAGRRARALPCQHCLDGSHLGQGCSREHAVQSYGFLALNRAVSEPDKIIDICGRAVGILFQDTPVASETLQFIEMSGFIGSVLAVNSTSRTSDSLVARRVSWLI
jgi:hypothetical protein